MKKNSLALSLIFCLFFLWAISSNLLPTMIRQLMKTCELNTFEVYPTQFSLALHGLGDQTKSGSAFLVMAIVGNACVPQFTAYIMHRNEAFYQVAYMVPLVCFVVCAYYGYRYKSLVGKA